MKFPPLTGQQMTKAIGLPIITVKDLKRASIPDNFIFIFQNTAHQGHWTLVLDHPDLQTIEFFDPLAMPISILQRFFPYYIEQHAGLRKVLFRKIQEKGYIGLEESTTPLERPTGTTCGYVCIYRWQNDDLDIEEFVKHCQQDFEKPTKQIPALVKEQLEQHGIL